MTATTTTTAAREIIVVQIDRVLYRKEDSGWCILSTRPQASDNGTAPVVTGQRLVCKGVVAFSVKEGDRLQLEGRFGTSAFNGETEFTFAAAIPHLPADMLSLLHYAVSITKGLGEQREAYIWGKYGDRWIEQDSLDIPCLPEKVQDNWRFTIRMLGEQKSQTAAITFLLGKSCTLNLASKAWEQWKENTIGIVGADCYQLAYLPYCGFKKVDTDIRHAFGISDDDPRRLDAAIIYTLGEMTSRGSTLIPAWMVKAETLKLVPFTDEVYEAGIDRIRTGGRVTLLDGGNMALSGDVQAETKIWQRFKKVGAS